MGFLTGITINGATYSTPPIAIAVGSEVAIVSFLESILGGIFTGVATVSLTGTDPVAIEINLGNSAYSPESISTIAPTLTIPFTQLACSSTTSVQTSASQCVDDDGIAELISALKKSFPSCCRGSSGSSSLEESNITVLRGKTINQYIEANGSPILLT